MGFWSKTKEKAKAWGSKDVGEAARSAGRALNEPAEKYLPTFKRMAMYDVGTPIANAGLSVAGGMRKMGKSLLTLHGHGTWLFFLLVVVVHAMHVLRNRTSFSPADPVFGMYVVLALLATFLFYNDNEDPFPGRRLVKFLMISIVAYYVPVLIAWMRMRGFLPHELASMLMLFAPVWLIFIILDPGDTATRWFAILFWIGWTIYLIIGALLPLLTDVGEINVVSSPAETIAGARAGISKTLTQARELFVRGPQESFSATKNFLNGSVNVATQEYYQGQVDQSQGQPSGVFITDLRPLLTRFDATMDDITVFATMKAKTFTDIIEIKNGCYLETQALTGISSARLRNISGRVTPPELVIEYTGAFQDTADLECTIPQKDYVSAITSSSASSGLVFNSSFAFETWGYVPYSFMDRDLGVSLRRANKDPAKEIGVQPRPVAKYTPGPVKIGMATDSQPYLYVEPASGARASLPAFGLTISNEWEGKGFIQDVDEVNVYVPSPFALDLDTCTPAQNEEGGVLAAFIPQQKKWEENTLYNQYTFKNINIRKGETFTTLRCQLKFEDNPAVPVLGVSGASVFTVFVRTNYTYTVNTRSVVNIRADPAIVQAKSQLSAVQSTSGLALGTPSPWVVNSVDQCNSPYYCNNNNQCSCMYSADDHKWTCAWKNGAFDSRVCWYLKSGNTIVNRCGYYVGSTTPNCADVPLSTPVNVVNSADECSDEVSCKLLADITVCTCAYTAEQHSWQCRWTAGTSKRSCWYNVDADTIHMRRYEDGRIVSEENVGK